MSEEQTVATPVLKIATAWAAAGVTSWADFASALAAVYTLLLITEWVWKKVANYRAKKAADAAE